MIFKNIVVASCNVNLVAIAKRYDEFLWQCDTDTFDLVHRNYDRFAYPDKFIRIEELFKLSKGLTAFVDFILCVQGDIVPHTLNIQYLVCRNVVWNILIFTAYITAVSVSFNENIISVIT